MYRVFLCVMLVSGAACMYSSKELEGYPAGYLSECPGTNKPLPIKNLADHLKHLTISVKNFYPRNTYNYYEMNKLAKDPLMNFNKPTIVYVGGFMDHPTIPFDSTISRVYSKFGYNVLLLNMNWFMTVSYPAVVGYMRTLSIYISEMLAQLYKYGLDPKRLELIGLSLGGQTMSYIAKNYKLQTGTKISTLIGLDPAGPCVRHLGPEERLDESDADFVIVLHTNIEVYGMATPLGHVDIYVNGGEFQPGDIIFTPCTVTCSHIRSFTLWIAAILNPNNFVATKCDSVQEARENKCGGRSPVVTNVVGRNTNRSVQGIFHLATGDTYPYIIGMNSTNEDSELFGSPLSFLEKTFEIIFYI